MHCFAVTRVEGTAVRQVGNVIAQTALKQSNLRTPTAPLVSQTTDTTTVMTSPSVDMIGELSESFKRNAEQIQEFCKLYEHMILEAMLRVH